MREGTSGGRGRDNDDPLWQPGRMTALRLPAAGNLWRTQRYYPWTAKRNGGMLESLKVGLSEGAGEQLNRSYAYSYFDDITALTEEGNQE